jgi:sulfite exporter TauE/SafE
LLDLIKESINANASLTPLFSLLLGLATSLHCLGMCGPLAVLYGKKKAESASYHVGRLLGYLSIGSLFILFSYSVEKFLGTLISDYLIIFMGLFFIALGFIKFFSFSVRMNLPFKRLSHFFHRFGKTGAFGLGLSSVFLPCGFLYTFFLALLGMKEREYAFLSIITFWLGTLPALSFAQVFAHKFMGKAKLRGQQVMAFIFILIGCMTIYQRVGVGFHLHQKNAKGQMCH